MYTSFLALAVCDYVITLHKLLGRQYAYINASNILALLSLQLHLCHSGERTEPFHSCANSLPGTKVP